MLRIEQLMSRFPTSCAPEVTLRDAARLMLENDCGSLPVTAGDGSGRLVGMITDRDICMAAQRRGNTLQELRVGDVMATVVRACNPSDSIGEAEAIMREVHVRRLPVVDSSERLVGLLSLADLALEAARQRGAKNPKITQAEIGDLLATICAPNSQPRRSDEGIDPEEIGSGRRPTPWMR